MTEPTKGPLMVCIGGNSCRIGSSFGPRGSNILFLDTDRRSVSDEMDLSLLVGEDVVAGEGSGGNLNLARACFKKQMEDIAPIVLGRPLVMILADIEGATSIAGAVEINSLLVKVGLPSLIVLIIEEGLRKATQRSRDMARVLVNGPLSPGVKVTLTGEDPETSENGQLSHQELMDSLQMINRAVSRSAIVQLPPMSWNLLKESGSSFDLSILEFMKDGQPPRVLDRIHTPSSIVIEVDRTATTTEVNELLASATGGSEGVNIGITEGPEGTTSWRLVMISPFIQDVQTGSDRSGAGTIRSFDEMMRSIDMEDITPDTSL